MNNNARNALAHNLKRLMANDDRFSTQMKLARIASRPGGKRVAQTTISIMLNPNHPVSPRLETIEAVAEAFKIPAWQLLNPDLKVGMVRRFPQAKEGQYRKEARPGK